MKKGEITTQKIVLIIILIASFLVILFFIFRLNLGKTTDAEVCHNSITARGSGVLPKESVPIDCKTDYICITKDGSCEKISNSEIKKAGTKKEVYKILADEMADCWWMFGEGKLNYVGKEFGHQLYCSLCSQVAFDNSLASIFSNNEINQNDFYTYLSDTSISGKDKTYLDYLVGLQKADAIEQTLATKNAQYRPISLDKYYYIMMGIISDVGVGAWAASLGGVTAAGTVVGLVLIPFTGGASVTLVAGGIITLMTGGGGAVAGYFIGTAVKGESGNDYIAPTIIEANSEDYNKLNCASIKTLA